MILVLNEKGKKIVFQDRIQICMDLSRGNFFYYERKRLDNLDNIKYKKFFLLKDIVK